MVKLKKRPYSYICIYIYIYIYIYIRYINFLIHSVIVRSDVLGLSKAALMWENLRKLG